MPDRLDVSALIHGRCPRCKQAPIFGPLFSRRALTMEPSCPVCGLDFEPEAGYYLGAMYVSYGIGIFTVLPVSLFLIFVLGASLAVTLVVMVVQTLLTMIFMYRASRLIWLHVDYAIDPR
jgi:uncharacterized protein (DUF983 family)